MNKISGWGIGFLTVISIASMPTTVTIGVDYTSNCINPFIYETPAIINDESGELCLSSDLSEQVAGEIILERIENMGNHFSVKEVQLQITDIIKHTSKFEIEEEYEEL